MLMASETEAREWRRFRAQSQRRLGPGAAFGAFGTVLLAFIRLLVWEELANWLLVLGLLIFWFSSLAIGSASGI